MTMMIFYPVMPVFMTSVPDEEELEYDDWSEIDDEDFEDMAEDRNDFHEMQLAEGLTDEEDDDHFPDDD
jgi:hypothetical protein